MEDKNYIKKNINSHIPETISIDKQIPNSIKVIKRTKNELFYIKPSKKIWANMEIKYKKTIKETLDFEELKKLVKANGVDEKLNYIYLKKLKLNNDTNFEKEFDQYKYTLSYDKRLELSNNSKDEINMSLKDYFQNILELIINEPNKFIVQNILGKFKLDFNKFGILINPNNNLELFYCFMLNKFLHIYEDMKTNEDEPENYLSYLKGYINQKDLTPVKCLALLWIMLTIENEEDDFFFNFTLKLYNSILSKSEGGELFCPPKERRKKDFIYTYQRILDDNKLFIEHSYFARDLNYIYAFFQEVIRSPLLKYIYSNIEGYSRIMQTYNYSDITIDKIIFIPMIINRTEYGLTQNNLDLLLINSLPFNHSFNVLSKVHNCFFLYVTILNEQGFLYIRSIFNKLDPDISMDTPKNIFFNLTKNPAKLAMLKEDGDVGDKGEIIIFGNNYINLKKLFYFSNISNYNKQLSYIEKEVMDLTGDEKIVEEDINNSFFKNILTVEEKNILLEGKYDKNKAKHLYIKSKKSKGFYLPFMFGRDKK